MRRLLLLAPALLLAACAALGEPPAPAAASPAAEAAPLPVPQLAPLAHWIGGRWVGSFEAGGRRFTVWRVYTWSFDRRLIIGKSFGERDGKAVQSRETVYYWNADSKRIEFIDYIDAGGGFGQGWLEQRAGQIYMDAKVVGNPGHPSWRAWIRESPDAQVIKVEALSDGTWTDFGTYPYRRQP